MGWVKTPHLALTVHGSAFSVRRRRNLRWNQVTALLEDHSGGLWVGVDSSLLVFQSGNFRQVRKRDRKPVGFVVGMTEDGEGNVWAETIRPPRTLLPRGRNADRKSPRLYRPGAEWVESKHYPG